MHDWKDGKSAVPQASAYAEERQAPGMRTARGGVGDVYAARSSARITVMGLTCSCLPIALKLNPSQNVS